MGREAEVVAALLPEFNARHPDTRVHVQQLPWTAAHEKLLTAYAGGSLPDLCQLGNTWLPELVALDALEPLDALAASSGIARDDYFSGILDTNRMPTRDGERLFGLPWYVDTRVLFYRTDLLRAAGHATPPQTWAEWLAAMRAIRRHGGARSYGVLLPLNEPDPLFALALQQGALLSDDDTRGAFSEAPFRRALGFYAGIFREGLAPAATNTQIANVWDEFGRGLFAFYVSGPWNIGELRRRLPHERQADWATAPLPGPDGPGVSTAGGSSLVIFKRSPRKAAAWHLIEYLSEPETMQRFHALTGNLPPRRSVWRTPALATDAPSQAFGQQLERVRAAPKLPEWERIFQEMQLAAERVVRGTQAIDAATMQLDAWVDALLEKRRWLRRRAHAVASAR
ncbi:MAG TPA: sugar ABC transporter substrate-binding protein [Caldimonas sp.]|nr:sugar ABC transporter substrate-binding protein [Caldimonas sp.]HEX4233611.1 sugar ABC transporter substrate-binding protein [Caldimonas sp.]